MAYTFYNDGIQTVIAMSSVFLAQELFTPAQRDVYQIVLEAQAAGIVTEVVPEERLFERAREAALAVAALPPASVRLTKRLMKRALAAQVAGQMQEEGRIFAERLQSAEAKEAMTAFFEKRKPDFSRF